MMHMLNVDESWRSVVILMWLSWLSSTYNCVILLLWYWT